MKKLLSVLLISSILLIQLMSGVSAQDIPDSACDESEYSALAQLPAGNVEAYFKAGRKEDAVSTRLYYKTFESSDCIEIGSGIASNKNYVKFGSIDVEPENNFVSIHVKLDAGSDLQAGASSPQVIFMDPANKPCENVDSCKVSYEGQDFILSPRKVSLSSDTVKVGVLSKNSKDIKEVIYSVDGKPAYSKAILEDFNLNYVSDGEHTIERKIVLKDGQSLTDSRVVKRGLEGGFTYLLISFIYGQSKILRIVGSLILLLIGYSIFVYVIRHIVARRRWKSEHFFDPNEHYDMSKVGARKGLTGEESYIDIFKHYKKFFIGGTALIVGIFLLNTYVVTFFTVDGVSMMPTLKNQSKKPLYILPVSLGRVNSNYYLPARGSIVVVQKDENNLFDANEQTEKSYVVKRVLGIPKDRVVVKDGKIKVYNKENEKGYEPDAEYKWITDLKGSENISMDIRLKEGEVFIVGDNRDESIDSRFYGAVQTSQVVGKVL